MYGIFFLLPIGKMPCYFPDSRQGKAGYTRQGAGAKRPAVTSSTVVDGGIIAMSGYDKVSSIPTTEYRKKLVKEIFNMNRQEELSINVMELANEFTNWDFKLIQEGEIYLVGTTLSNQTGQEMNVYYKIVGEKAQLDVFVSEFEYDGDFVDKKVNELAQKFSIGVAGVDGRILILESKMPLQVFESEMHVIVMERMTAMVEAMTEIINYDREDKEMMECYTVGDVYQKAVNHQEAPVFDIDDCGINLSVYIRRPTAHEAEQFASGKPFEIRLVQLRNVIFPMFKFGDMGWMDAPYNVHLSKNLNKLEVPADGQGLAMTVHLYDTVTGKLLCNRLISLSSEISRGLIKMVAEQAEKPFNMREYVNNFTSVYSAYPTKKLLGMASYSYRLR